MDVKNFYSASELVAHLQTKRPTLYCSSQTTTVIPFERLSEVLEEGSLIGNLSTMKGSLAILANGDLRIEGFVTWKEAKEFCLAHGREIMTSPTEELAGVLAGIATSCTGERSFGFKNLRSQIVEVNYLNYKGLESTLLANKKLDCGIDLAAYQRDFSHYESYKNAPYPRMEFETDLMTGTEGQLGVITSAVIKTIEHVPETYIFILLPKWEENFRPHLEVFKAVQPFRGRIRACELIDANSLGYLPKEKNPGKNEDVIFLEIRKDDFEGLYEDLLSHLKSVPEDKIFQMDASRCRDLRMSVPRAIFEMNTRMGVSKKGTDVQVSEEHFEHLLSFYRELARQGVEYNLFGHFGDAHLHFNFMPTPEKSEFCNQQLERLYAQVLEWKGSPFAEHGIGLLKQKFIGPFFHENQRKVFKQLKEKYDPHRQFFREGFMSC